MKLLAEWLRILEEREFDLIEFTERHYIKNSPDFWFYEKLLNENRRLQIIGRERYLKLKRLH